MENPSKDSPVKEISLDEFRESGMMFAANQFLHHFGMCLCAEVDKDNPDKTIRMYPARTLFRGFDDKSIGNGYMKTAKYLSEYIKDIKIESED